MYAGGMRVGWRPGSKILAERAFRLCEVELRSGYKKGKGMLDAKDSQLCKEEMRVGCGPDSNVLVARAFRWREEELRAGSQKGKAKLDAKDSQLCKEEMGSGFPQDKGWLNERTC